MIGLGLAALGRPGYINIGHNQDIGPDKSVESMQANAWQVLDAAWASGVRYFDVARSYGLAEIFLAGWIAERNIGKKDITVASKWGYRYTADWKISSDAHEIKDHSVAHFRKQMVESKQILGKHLDLYQIHSATLDSGVLDDHDVLDQLAKKKKDGLAIGLSLSGIYQGETLRKAITIKRDGLGLFSTVQATWNLLNPSTTEVLNEASESGLNIIIKESLANGRLTSRNRASNFAGRKELLDTLADSKQSSIDAIAIAFAMQQPWADVVLSGAANVDQLNSNMSARNIIFDREEDKLLQEIQEDPNEYWETRSQLIWN
jgi:aryl-alcohol dehydrogenase-like predicted oxidoreductase